MRCSPKKGIWRQGWSGFWGRLCFCWYQMCGKLYGMVKDIITMHKLHQNTRVSDMILSQLLMHVGVKVLIIIFTYFLLIFIILLLLKLLVHMEEVLLIYVLSSIPWEILLILILILIIIIILEVPVPIQENLLIVVLIYIIIMEFMEVNFSYIIIFIDLRLLLMFCLRHFYDEQNYTQTYISIIQMIKFLIQVI